MQIQEIEPQHVLIIRTVTTPAGIGQACAETLPEVYRFIQARSYKASSPPLAIYFSFTPDRVEMAGGMALSSPEEGMGPVEAATLPGGRAVVAMHVGPYEELIHTHRAVQAFIADEGLRSDISWEVYWTDPRSGTDPREWKTEVFYLLTT